MRRRRAHLPTADPASAVDASTAAANRLLENGTHWLYQKYCSTFDSTDRGNIGPVADALARLVGQRRGLPAGPPALTVGTPATPAVGRSQYQGHLFVGDRLLSESPLRVYPLTPMRDSDLVRVLGRQTPGRVVLVPLTTVRAGAGAIRAELRRIAASDVAHVLVDAVCEEDLDALAAAVTGTETAAGTGDRPLVHRPLVPSGAAGLGAALARSAAGKAATRHASGTHPARPAVPAGRRLIVSGSSSARSREQVAAFRGPTVTVDPMTLDPAILDAVTVDTATVDPATVDPAGGVAPAGAGLGDIIARVATAFSDAPHEPVLVAATVSPDSVRAAQAALGRARAAAIIERALAEVATSAVAKLGVSHLIVAGGETSGAVAAALGVRTLRLGRNAAPGVPWMIAPGCPGAGRTDPIALLFKSGNFGEPGLFTTAWDCAP